MNLLIKFPTRSRPDKFFSVLDKYYELLDELSKTRFIISCDSDDLSMNCDNVINKLKEYKNLEFFFGNNKNKVEAINADMNDEDYDIILLASDDMIPQEKGYDTIIRQSFNKFFPDTDGVLWFNDGYQGNNLNTLCILGKKYYKRFNYIYNPTYISLWCDTEFTDISKILKKVKYIPHVIIKHEHPVWLGEIWDPLQIKNDSFNNIDKLNYEKRKKENFFIQWTTTT
jgi:hypothetical protein